MTKSKKIKTIILSFALIFVCLLSTLLSAGYSSYVVYASNINVVGAYTNVMDDLQQDNTFNVNDYVVVSDNYSLDVITIAESSEKELFVYVYQPCANYGNLVASYITISNAFHNSNNNRVYSLTLINYSGVFYKYVVSGFVVSNDNVRYYDISSILRPFDADIDAGTGNNNTITNVSYSVAKQFTISGENISVAGTDVIEITDKYVGFVRYKSNNAPSWINNDSCDNHFVAFNTDRDIDKLFEADVYYTSQSFYQRDALWDLDKRLEYGEIQEQYAYLNYTEKHTYTGGQGWNEDNLVWGVNTYSWQEISTGSDFIANENRTMIYECGIFNSTVETQLTDEGMANISNKNWVLCFTQTDYDEDDYSAGGSYIYDTHKTIVGNVMILRLKFETDGVTYNLGVVDNMQSGDGIPENVTKVEWSLSETFKLILMLLMIIILIILLSPILPVLFSVIWWVIKAILKAIWWVISLPFKIFKRKDKK